MLLDGRLQKKPAVLLLSWHARFLVTREGSFLYHPLPYLDRRKSTKSPLPSQGTHRFLKTSAELAVNRTKRRGGSVKRDPAFPIVSVLLMTAVAASSTACRERRLCLASCWRTLVYNSLSVMVCLGGDVVHVLPRSTIARGLSGHGCLLALPDMGNKGYYGER